MKLVLGLGIQAPFLFSDPLVSFLMVIYTNGKFSSLQEITKECVYRKGSGLLVFEIHWGIDIS